MSDDARSQSQSRLDSRTFLDAVRSKLDEREAHSSAASTNWSLIRDAAGEDDAARTLFVERYLPVVRTYLTARWRGKPYATELEDAVQEVFLQCFQEHGALERVDPERGSFSAFFYGVVRRVAQAFETRKARLLNKQKPGTFHADQLVIDELSMTSVFDKAWAMSILREAGDLNEARANEEGGDRLRRVELLRLRFQEGKPIRDIAAMWGEEAKRVHWAYAKARDEFKDAMGEVLVLRGYPKATVETECRRVFAVLAG